VISFSVSSEFIRFIVPSNMVRKFMSLLKFLFGKFLLNIKIIFWL